MRDIIIRLITIFTFMFIHDFSCMVVDNVLYDKTISIMTIIVILYELRAIYKIMKNREE